MAKQANEQKKPDKKYDVWRMRWGFILCGLFALLLVPGSTFMGPGHFRLAFCVSRKTVEDSLESFRQLAKKYR